MEPVRVMSEAGLRVAVRMTEYVVGISVMDAGEVLSGEGVDTGTCVPAAVSTD